MGGSEESVPVKAAAKVYSGSMVGDSAGFGRGLVAGDVFRGHALEQRDNTDGSAGDLNVKVKHGRYRLEAEVTGASAVTDVTKDVYASDDQTLTLTKGSNSFVGKGVRWLTGTTCVVEFRSGEGASDVTDHEHTAGTDGGPLTSPRVITGINAVNGLALLKVTAAGTAVNEFTLANAATAGDPALTATGGDTDISALIAAKGAGEVKLGQATSAGVRLVADQPILDSAGLELLKFTKTSTAVNELTLANAATGGDPPRIGAGETEGSGLFAGKGAGEGKRGQATSVGVRLVADQPILDSAGLALIKFTKTTTAVNWLQVVNQSTGVSPSLESEGEADIGLTVRAKGTGTLQLGRVTGSVQIGTVGTDLLGFYGTTPVTQPTTNADPGACAGMTHGAGPGADGTTPAGAEYNLARADLDALKTAVDANKAAIDAINADFAILGLTA